MSKAVLAVTVFVYLSIGSAEAANVNLAWDPNSESDLGGYPLSYGTSPGQYTGSATVNGVVSDDGQPSPPETVTVSWTSVSGPGTVTFSAPSAASTTASFSAAGTYVLRLTASDGALSTSDDVNVIVQPPNQAPTVNAGADQIIVFNNTTLSGSASDDGHPILPGALNLIWTRVSGPGTVTFSAPNSATTNASFSTVGEYILRLTASDGALTGSDNVKSRSQRRCLRYRRGVILRPSAATMDDGRSTIDDRR